MVHQLEDRTSSDDFLTKIERDDRRKTAGLSEQTVLALRELSTTPYRNKTSLRILLDDIKLGRYIERNLFLLVYF